jgi:hypothetical protein
MRNRILGTSLAASLLMVGLAACSDDGPTGPRTPFDPDAAAQAATELESRLDGDSDVMQSLRLVAPALEAEGGVAVQLLPGGLATVPRPVDPGSMVDPAFSMMLEPVFPPEILGSTFEWNETLGRYAISERAGAPANGVRFILYAVDPFTGAPALPLVEVGILDLTDEGGASTTRLGVLAETAGVVRLDYTVTASYSLSGSAIRATATGAGFISDGTRTLEFDLAQTVAYDTAAETMAVDLAYDLEMSDEGVRVVIEASSEIDLASPESIVLDLAMTITDGGNVTVFTGAVDATDAIDGTIAHNGETVARIGGTTSAPTFTDAGGEPLTAAEMAALGQVFGLIDDVFDFAEAVFEPFGGGTYST